MSGETLGNIIKYLPEFRKNLDEGKSAQLLQRKPRNLWQETWSFHTFNSLFGMFLKRNPRANVAIVGKEIAPLMDFNVEGSQY